MDVVYGSKPQLSFTEPSRLVDYEDDDVSHDYEDVSHDIVSHNVQSAHWLQVSSLSYYLWQNHDINFIN